MRIRELKINRFGHFNDLDICFPDDGLQIIYGPNEAGKTTLLEFLRCLLFDFPNSTPYDFGGKNDLAGTANLVHSDGRTIELRRRKGRKDTIAIKIDGATTDLEDADWLRMLDHADRGLFKSIFAFGLDELARGEEGLKHERLESALFGGSLGGHASPDKIIVELTRQAEDLFKKAGFKPAINSALASTKSLTKEIKDGALRPATYQAASLKLDEAEKLAEVLRSQLIDLRIRHATQAKLVAASPKWHQLQLLKNERQALIVPVGIPIDARQQFELLRQETKNVELELTNLSARIQESQQILSGLKLNPESRAYGAEIKACIQWKQSYVDASHDLPQQIQRRNEILRQIDRELIELRADWNQEDLRAFSIDIPSREHMAKLSASFRTRESAATKVKTNLENDDIALKRAQTELQSLGTPRSILSIEAVLDQHNQFAADCSASQAAQNEMAKLVRKLTALIRRLSPPLAKSAREPHALPVPREETIAVFEQELNEIRERLRTAEISLDEETRAGRELHESLETALATRRVPSREELAAARSRRDLGWELFLSKPELLDDKRPDAILEEWLAATPGVSLPDQYERAVREADIIADQIYENANEVAERDALRRQLAANMARIEEKQQRLTDQQEVHQQWERRWNACWEECGFMPLDPAAMRAWLDDHTAVHEATQAREELAIHLSQLADSIAAFASRLQSALETDDNEIPQLLLLAQQCVQVSKEKQRRKGELENEIERLEIEIVKHDSELEQLAAAELIDQRIWQDMLGRLKLPATWDTELAAKVIDKLLATRVRLEGLPGEESRIVAMQLRIDEFRKRVRHLCDLLDPSLAEIPPELAIEKLADQLASAEDAHRKQDDWSLRLRAAQNELQRLSSRRTDLGAQATALFKLLSAADEAEFFVAVNLVEQANSLDKEIHQLQRELDVLLVGEQPDEFEATLARSPFSILEAEVSELQTQLVALDDAKRKADQHVGAARKELDQLDGSSSVAVLTEQLSQKRSLLVAEIDRYMPLIYARHLLNAAISRFERENQPEMIATVSELLTKMTGGKYVEFDRFRGGKQSVLVRMANGVERTPDQLSTGTREQLYLAIRLAYVLHYCRRSQPLPIIIDDVLVNFDEQRTRHTLIALADIAPRVQVLFFTCHQHLVSLAKDILPKLAPIELPNGA